MAQDVSDPITADFVVLGGGIAGVSCAQTLRLLAPDTASIVLVTASEVVKSVTELTHLTKLLASFSVTERDAGEWQLENQGVRLVKAIVNEVDRVEKIVKMSDGGEVRYDKLCICTGGQPRVITGDNPWVLGIRDTQSVMHFQELLKDAARVMVVGNGGIATEIVYELDNVDVVWAIKDSSISSVFVDAGAGEFLTQKIFKKSDNEDKLVKPTKRMKYSVDKDGDASFIGAALGPDWHKGFSTDGKASGKSVKIEYKVEIEKILTPEEFKASGLDEFQINNEETDKTWNVYVKLTSGRVYGCDFIVSATGVNPAGDLYRDVVEVDTEGGVVVDHNMVTSDPDIFAAGDICSASWEPSEHWMQMRLWTQARQMGIMAARAMVARTQGEQIELDFCFEMFAHVTRFFDYKVVLLGLFNGQKLENNYEVLLRVTPGVEYVKTVMKGGKMQGAILIGDTDLEETFENLILNQLDLSSYGEELLNPDIDIEDYFD